MLEAIDLNKSYIMGANTLSVLKGINLTIKKGKIVGIVGPSGAGKSTLIHLLGGLDFPTSGNVLLEGVDIAGFDERKRARLRNKRFGFVFQFYHLLAEFTAVENVMLPALIGNNEPKKKMRERAVDILTQCGLESRLNHRPRELSGGEQQRVAIARALINTPEIVFCDEPTGNLDTSSGLEIRNLLWKFNKEYKTTLVIVTHESVLMEGVSEVFRLQDGSIVN